MIYVLTFMIGCLFGTGMFLLGCNLTTRHYDDMAKSILTGISEGISSVAKIIKEEYED